MAIFNSYVSLPEGIQFPTADPASSSALASALTSAFFSFAAFASALASALASAFVAPLACPGGSQQTPDWWQGLCYLGITWGIHV